MVRLIGDVVALPGGHAEKKRCLLEGLCKLIQTDAWVWALSCQREPDKPQVYVSFLHGGFTDESFPKLLQAIEHPQMIALASKFFLELKKKNTHLTRPRFQITTPDQLQRSGADLAWKEANIGPTILSMRPLDATASSTIALYRHYARPEFTQRESRIAHIVLAEIPWLHEQGWPEDRGVNVPSLSRRQRLALNLLIQGHSQKQIAAHMKISMHTAQGYIKDTYRFFGVHSQAALMSRFFRGNGHDLT
jgi:DNA-binding CsgD family transcriptional regulator